MSLQLKAEARKETRRSELNQLRANGKIPGVVYGKKLGSEAITVDEKQLLSLLRGHRYSVVNLEMSEGSQPVMIHEVQRDNLNRNLLHVDFHQISMDELVHTSVRLEPDGEPVGVKEGGMLQMQRHELEIQCLPADIPEQIIIEIGGMRMGDSLTAGEIKLPQGVKLTLDPDEVVATVLAPKKEVQETEEAAEPAAESGAKEESKEEEVSS